MKLLLVTTTTATFYGRCASKSTTKTHAAGNANGYSREPVSEEKKKARHSCLTDEDSLNYLDPLKGLKDGEKYCDIVRPGQSAKFQLVSTLMGLGIKTKKHELSSHLAL